MDSLAVLILAAGMGRRMKSDLPKVVAQTCDKSLIHHVLDASADLVPQKTVLVTGHKREVVEALVADILKDDPTRSKTVHFAFQADQKGTGDAVRSALPNLKGFSGTVLILYGDTPLIKSQTLKNFLAFHKKSRAVLSLITVNSDGTHAYGRIIRDGAGAVQKIVEAKDCTADQIKITEVNSGIYAVDADFLGEAVGNLKNDNAQKEYYLTDIVEAAVSEHKKVAPFLIDSLAEVQGVNDWYDMSLVNKSIMEERVKYFLQNGVRFVQPESVTIEKDVAIGAGTVIGPNVQIKGNSSLGANCVLEGSAFIQDSTIGDNVHLRFCVRLENAKVHNACAVGPFAHLRPETVLESEVKVGNFVEIKKSHLLKGAKASHLTYLGDATVGEETNIGAGTITCNYDGYNKFQTTIGAHVFIGSNSSLVAPVEIGDGATVGAGSVITKNVSSDSLALTRGELKVRAGWSKRKRESSKK